MNCIKTLLAQKRLLKSSHFSGNISKRPFVMWIRQNSTPEWNFPGTEGKQEGSATFDHVTGNQLFEAIKQVAESQEDELPFQIYDCRESHEREIQDIAEEITFTDDDDSEINVKLPKIDLDLYEL